MSLAITRQVSFGINSAAISNLISFETYSFDYSPIMSMTLISS